MNASSNQITKTELKQRGWKESLIKRFFPVPTATARNPRYRSAAPMKLYDVDNVLAIESTPEFQAAKSAADQRAEKAKIASASKRKDTLNWARSLPEPEIPQYPPGTLQRLARDHYNDLWLSRGDFERYAGADASPEFLDRICVNFLRHELSPYEEQLLAAAGRTGASKARRIIRNRILTSISRAYPSLAEECARQKQMNPDKSRGARRF